MSEVARQSTSRTVMVGPVLDADGAAVTDGIVGDLKISKNGAAPAALNGSATLTHRHTGHYSLALTASDLDTVGGAQVTIDDGTNCMPPKEITVVEEEVYDDIFAASAVGYLKPVTAGRDLVVDAAGLADANTVKIGPTGSGTAQTAKDLGAIDVNADGSVKSGNGTEVWSSTNPIPANTTQVEGTDANDYFATLDDAVLTAIAALNDPSASEIADAVWDEATAGHTTSGTFGEQVKTDIDAILADTNELQTDWANGGRLDLLIDAILADTNELQTDWTNGGRLDLLIDAILADTNELQTDWANGGRLDNILDARASQTSVDTIDDLLDTEIAALTSALAVVDNNVDAILLDTGTDGVIVASIGASAIDAIHDEPITEPSAMFAWASATHRKGMQTLMALMRNEINSDSDSVDVRNDADNATLWSYPSSDDGTTFISGEAA